VTAMTRTRLAKDERRELIVGAAATVFAERGYDEVSTSELAQAAGISRGLLSHYFPSKRDLYLAVVRRFLDMPDLPIPAYVEGATVEDRVRESVAGWLELVERGRGTWLAAAGLASGHPDEDLRVLMDRNIARTADRICEVTGLGHVRTTPEVVVALHGYAGFVIAVSRQWLQEGLLDRERIGELLSGVLITLVHQHIPAILEPTPRRV
jgi:AcrR family transcriptional regulator